MYYKNIENIKSGASREAEESSFINSVDGYHVRSVFCKHLVQHHFVWTRVFHAAVPFMFFRVSFVVIQEVAHRCRFSSVLRNFCWDKDKSYLIDWCILQRERHASCINTLVNIQVCLRFLSIQYQYFKKWYNQFSNENYVFFEKSHF